MKEFEFHQNVEFENIFNFEMKGKKSPKKANTYFSRMSKNLGKEFVMSKFITFILSPIRNIFDSLYWNFPLYAHTHITCTLWPTNFSPKKKTPHYTHTPHNKWILQSSPKSRRRTWKQGRKKAPKNDFFQQVLSSSWCIWMCMTIFLMNPLDDLSISSLIWKASFQFWSKLAPMSNED